MRYCVFGMNKLFFIVACLTLLGCGSGNQVSGLKVLIGETTFLQGGTSPVQDAVIVISGDTIRAAGMRRDVPIPQDSERTDLTGKWVVPAQGSRIAVGEESNLLILNHAPNGVA